MAVESPDSSTTAPNAEALREALARYAEWQGYGHGERAGAWLARLEVNRPELERLAAAPTPSCAPYVPVGSVPRAPEGMESPQTLRGDAAEAIERARKLSGLNAFTWLAQPQPGVPVAVKDLMRVRGAPLSCGSNAFDREVAGEDAEVVSRLRRAGMTVMGLANLHEFAYGITSDNPRFGRVLNPAAPARIPGGSSGGSAAAIAAGIVRLALGTDTAGSIRVPAACCGIVGFKPGYDVLPRDGVIDLAWSLDHVGPMAASVEECAALFGAMLGLPATPPWRYPDLEGRRVGRLRGYFEDPLDPEVLAAVGAACEALEADGARIADGDVEGMELAPAIQFATIAPEASTYHAQRLGERGADMGEDVRVRLEMGLLLPAHAYVKAQRLRAQLAGAIEAAFADADVLLCATLRAPAPPVGATKVAVGNRDYPLQPMVTQLTLPFNLTGMPAITVPFARSREGVPIGVQIIGRRGDDWRVLAFAERLQQAGRG